MALTLVEAAKGESNVFIRGVIETFIETQRILQILPYRGIPGSADGIQQESALPSAATRGVNEAFTPSTGRTEEIIQSLKIYGGDIGIDPFILRTKGADQAARQVAMKIKSISNLWITDFFKGDSAAEPRDFDGLQTRLDGFNVVSAGTTANGATLSLTLLDEAILRCHNPVILAMGRQMHIRLTQAARDSLVSGSVIRTDKNEFGRAVLMYNDLEVVPVTDNQNTDNILDFTEAAVSGTDTASSIYVMGLGDDGVEGIENGSFQVRSLGEDNTTPREDTRVEWYNNFHINHPRSAIRLRNIADAAFTS